MGIATASIACVLLLAAAGTSSAQVPAAEATPAPTVRDADPALWVLKDEDTTIYLFGTIHVLPPGLSWFDEAIAEAFESADELRTEVVMPEDAAALVPVMMRYAVDPSGRTLSSRFTPQQLDEYRRGTARMAVPAEQFERFEPWFVGLQLSLGVLLSIGMDPNHGVEEVLRQAAKSAGKRTTAFETVDEQMGFIDSTPEQEQIAGLLEILEDGPKVALEVQQLVDTWARGEPDETGALMNESMEAMPVTARVLLTDRNRRWAQSLRERLAEPGTVFVAVGAGHLAGERSVQHFLEQLGLRVERVAY